MLHLIILATLAVVEGIFALVNVYFESFSLVAIFQRLVSDFVKDTTLQKLFGTRSVKRVEF